MKDNHTQNYDEEEVNNDELKSEKQEEEEDTIVNSYDGMGA